MKYPVAPKSDAQDLLHGVRVEDPYRVLEDSHDPRTRAWIDEENRLTEGFLATSKERAGIRARLQRLTDQPRESMPWKEGSRYYVLKNTGMENQDRLYARPTPKGPDTEILDPNSFSVDGTAARIFHSVSKDDRLIAFQVSQGGSDWVEIFVKEIATGKQRPDHLKWIKFSSLSWAADASGFYYSRYDAPAPGAELSGVNRFQKVYFHTLGKLQAEDRLVFERPDDGEIGSNASVTADGRYLIMGCWKGSSRMNQLYFIDLQEKNGKARPIVPTFEASYRFVGNLGSRFFLMTSKGASRLKVIEIDVDKGLASAKDVVPETKDTLQSTLLLNGHLVLLYMVDAANELKIVDLAGKKVRDVALPGVGVVFLNHTLTHTDEECFLSFENLTTPPTSYRLAVPEGATERLHAPAMAFDPDDFETRRVFYPSKDGTKIPLFIGAKKGLKLDGGNPAFLYGYGGFNNPVLPWFRVSRINWMEMGGLYASACIRGGGEYGDAWHEAGTLAKKQNVFDDFIAASEYLIREKYTTSKKLGINGGSNGGLLVGACMTQRPELFGAVVAGVGVFDMLRFHKFTIGWAWVSDFGSPDKPEDFKNLLKYSPLHNLKSGTAYPPTLITTGDHDDRVVPAHSFKFTAALQAAQGGPAPVLIRIDTQTGHCMGKPVGKLLDETADIYTFLHRVLAL